MPRSTFLGDFEPRVPVIPRPRRWSAQARTMKPITWLVLSAMIGCGRWSRLGRRYAAHRVMLVLTVTAHPASVMNRGWLMS